VQKGQQQAAEDK
jgi:hypothetical protein